MAVLVRTPYIARETNPAQICSSRKENVYKDEEGTSRDPRSSRAWLRLRANWMRA